MTASRLALLAFAAAGLAAADPDDLTVNDLRLQVGLPPSSATVTSNRTGSTFTRDDEVSWSQRGRWSLQWAPPVSRLTPASDGFCLLEVTSMRLVSAPARDGSELKERALLAGVHLGLAWVVLQDTTLELTGSGAAGLAWQERTSDYGQAYEVGARLGVSWAPPTAMGRPVLGVAVLGLVTRLVNQAELGGTTYDLILRSQGVVPAVTLGWRF